MTPQHLHAIANLWSLSAVWPKILKAAQRAAGASGADRGTLQAWRPGSGVHTGRTGDQILDAILRNTESDADPYAERRDRTAATIAWLADQVVPPAAASTLEALSELRAGVTDLRPNTALQIAMHIGAEDRAIRRLLAEPDDQAPLAGVFCPACRTPGSLAIRGSNPNPAGRAIVCNAFACTRGGIPSIWDQAELAATMAAAA